mmetsp:Transcript_104577/g.127736  ORF Transcript_104577/g.127736 Transcript_104577/m.127736 type:complete len:219 (-) Transcript_104577:43-699(-)
MTDSKSCNNIDITKIDIDSRKLRIYLDGIWDLTHYGHFRLFMNVKKKFPNSIIIVGVCSDKDTHTLKGETILSENERSESISHCKWVDEVICPCPWFITNEFLIKHNIDYVAHDGLLYDDGTGNDVYAFVKNQGKFIATQRTKGISTSMILNRILIRRNDYIKRNLKRGESRHDIGVTIFEEKMLLYPNTTFYSFILTAGIVLTSLGIYKYIHQNKDK